MGPRRIPVLALGTSWSVPRMTGGPFDRRAVRSVRAALPQVLRWRRWLRRGDRRRPKRAAGLIRSTRAQRQVRESGPLIWRDERSHRPAWGRSRRTMPPLGDGPVTGHPYRRRGVPRAAFCHARGGHSQRGIVQQQHPANRSARRRNL